MLVILGKPATPVKPRPATLAVPVSGGNITITSKCSIIRITSIRSIIMNITSIRSIIIIRHAKSLRGEVPRQAYYYYYQPYYYYYYYYYCLRVDASAANPQAYVVRVACPYCLSLRQYTRGALVRYPVARCIFWTCRIQGPCTTTIYVALRRKGFEKHFDCVFIVCVGPGL
jgi:hypothetical protein